MTDDWVSFSSALKELGLSEEQLKRLVSEGEIRAIRDDESTSGMKFRRDDVIVLARKRFNRTAGPDEYRDD